MPKLDHYAIAIGLTTYPGLKDPPADLKGPENDVESVCEWLRSHSGGDLPPDNIKKIISSDFPPPPSDEPWAGHLDRRAFLWVEDIAQRNAAAGLGRTVGQRLYIYMSGHGFSTVQRTGCLLTADVAPNKVNANISPSAWMNWWQDAGYFQEHVLILDACMNRMSIAVPSPPPLAAVNGMSPPGPAFAAFAAKRPLKAVETIIAADDGKMHGVFTWAFLDGVKGAAVNAAGTVTGQSMANWLRNALPQRLSEADRNNPEISLEPEIVAENPQIVLARGVAPMLFDVELQFEPDAVGKIARLWSGAPPQAKTMTTSAAMAVQLPAGLHVVEVPESGHRQGFEVTCAGSVAVTQKAGPVSISSNSFNLSFDAGDAANQISVETAEFETADSAKGRIDTRLRCGIYRARVRAGRSLVDQVFFLDRNTALGAADVPPMASAIPFFEAPLSHENQSALVDHLADRPAPMPGKAEIAVVARSWTSDKAAGIPNPWEDVRVVDARGREIADLSKTGTKDSISKDGIAHLTVEIAPKVAFLRFRNGSAGLAEMALPAISGWRLETYLLRFQTGEQEAAPRISVIMRNGRDAPPESQVLWSIRENDRFEKASIALAEGRPIMNTALLEELLWGKYKNPLEGIAGAHLLLIQYHADQSVDLNDLNEVVRNLRTLVGNEHPDVEALSLRCPDLSMRRTKPFTAPPLFELSWRLMVEASQRQPELVPLDLWKRVTALSTVPPYLAWSPSRDVRKSYRSTLAKNLVPPAPIVLSGLDRIVAVDAVEPMASAFPSAMPISEVAMSEMSGRPPGAEFGTHARRRSESLPENAGKPIEPVMDFKWIAAGSETGPVSLGARARRLAEIYQLPASALEALKKKQAP